MVSNSSIIIALTRICRLGLPEKPFGRVVVLEGDFPLISENNFPYLIQYISWALLARGNNPVSR